jgi:hypothetical protein
LYSILYLILIKDHLTRTQSGSVLSGSGSRLSGSGLRLPENFEFNIGVNNMSKNKKSKHVSPNKKKEVTNENINSKQNANTNSYDDNHGKDIDDSPPNWWGTIGTGPGATRMGTTGMGMNSSQTYENGDHDDKNDSIYSNNHIDVSHRNDASKDRVTIELTDLREQYLRNPSKHHHNVSSNDAGHLNHDNRNDKNDIE